MANMTIKRRTAIASALGLALGNVATSQAVAALPSNAILKFNAGTQFCAFSSGGTCYVTDLTGSYFTMDTDGNGTVANSEKTAIAPNQGITLGIAQPTVGQSHTGLPTGTENTTIDMAWGFFGNTGMHNTVTPVTVVSDDGAGNVTLDFTGWRVDWNGIEDINMGGDPANFPSDTGLATLTCAVDCSAGDTYVLDYAAHVPLGDPSNFGGVPYTLHLEGTVSAVSAVPVPAAVWLFGSGLLGLVGVARRRKG